MIHRRRVRAQQVIRYRDERLADGTVHRRYEDGRVEWRRRQAPSVVVWRDAQGQQGADELLGRGIIKRTTMQGVTYGREQGFGRTAWAGGRVVTVNATNLAGPAGALLGIALGGALVASVIAPPDAMSAADEEMLRQELQRQGTQSTSSSEDGGDDWGSDDLGGDDAFG